MVTLFAPLVLILSLTSPAPGEGTRIDGGTRAIGTVLEQEAYPWYDAGADKVRPLLPWPDLRTGWFKSVGDWFTKVFETIGGWFRGLNGWRLPFNLAGLGDLIAVGLVMLLLTALLVGLLEMMRRYKPVSDDLRAASRSLHPGSARRIEGMPAGVGMDVSDPWAEAVRLRKQGDYSGAVVYLFAHQLLTLDRLEKIRITPGKTGRQLVRSLRDRAMRDPVEPTLRLFESVYYGHQGVTAEAFEAVWTLAESFERRIVAETAT